MISPTFDQAKKIITKDLENSIRIRLFWRFRCREQVIHLVDTLDDFQNFIFWQKKYRKFLVKSIKMQMRLFNGFGNIVHLALALLMS